MPFDRSVLITGGTAGLGLEAAQSIAKAHPEYLVVVASRSDKAKAADVINRNLSQKNCVFQQLDVASKASVRAFVAQWNKDNRPPIQALLLNAGLQFFGKMELNGEGIERTFGISHVGNSSLFHLMVPYLADGARVIVTTSGTHDPAQTTGLPDPRYITAAEVAHPEAEALKVSGQRFYATTKLCNVLWTYALDRRLRQASLGRHITVNAFDPGLMPGTGLARDSTVNNIVFTRVMPRVIPVIRLALGPNVHRPSDSGARLAKLAVDPEFKDVSGKYFEGVSGKSSGSLKDSKSSKDSYDKEKQEDLWQWTIKFLAKDDVEAARFEQLQ